MYVLHVAPFCPLPVSCQPGDGKRSEDSESSGVERFIVPAAAKAFFCFFSLGGPSHLINRVADLWFMKQNNIKMELPRGQNQ